MLGYMIIDNHQAEKLAAERRHKADMLRREEALKKIKLAEEIAYKKLWGWKMDGKIMFKNVNDAFHGIEIVLIPHRLKKQTIIELITICNIIKQKENKSYIYINISQLILNYIYPFYKRTRKKSYIIKRKLIIMREIRQITRHKYMIHNDHTNELPSNIFFDYIPYSIAIQPMEASFHSRVPLSRVKLLHLKMLRNSMKDAFDTFQNTQQLIQKIDQMRVCQSVYHERSAGCLKCGGVMRHGKLMVHAKNRASGATVLVANEYEYDILLVEVVEHEKTFNYYRSLLLQLESDIRQNVVYEIQSWWACHLSHRYFNKVEERRDKSNYYYRIRRLVKMKNAIDHWDIWTTSLESLETQFCDILPEFAEYRLYKSKKIQKLVVKFVEKMLSKYKKNNTLSLLKQRYQERKRLERLISYEIIRKKEKVVTELLRHQILEQTKKMIGRTWMCDRYECNKRVFYSEHRYRTHMNIHHLKDDNKMKAREELYRLKLQRLEKEEIYYDYLHDIHNEVLHCLPCDHTIDGSNNDNRILNQSGIEAISSLPQISSNLNLIDQKSNINQQNFSTILPPIKKGRIPVQSRKYFLNLVKLDKKKEIKNVETSLNSQDSQIITTSSNSTQNTNYSEENFSNDNKDDNNNNDDNDDKDRSYIMTKSNILQKTEQQSTLTTSTITSNGYGTKKLTKIVESDSLTPRTLQFNNLSSTTLLLPSTPLSPTRLSTTTPILPSITITTTTTITTTSQMNFPQYYQSPEWLTMPQLSSYSELIQSNKKIYLEVVSHVPSIYLNQSKYLISNSMFKIGTSEKCDCIIENELPIDFDKRYVCHISSLHCVIYTSLISSSSKVNNPISKIVDNHSLWGTYVVSIKGVEKVTTIQSNGATLSSGDLICIGLIRNGPKTMSSVDANKAMIVFRVRIE